MTHRLLITLLSIATVITTLWFLQPQPVTAQCATECDCRVDFRCQQNKLINPRYQCDVYYCYGATSNPPTPGREEILRFNIFGVGIKLNSEKAIQQLITVTFSAFLGIVAIVAVINGVVAAVKRSNANKPEEVQKLMKTMQNSIVGFILVGLSLLIVQVIASFIGIGSIFNIVDFGNFLPNPSDPAIQEAPQN